MTLLSPFPIQKSDITFGAEYDYRLIDAILGEGVIGSGDFAVSQKAAGANMSVDVAAGTAVVEVDSPYGGKRLVRNDATMNSGTPGSPGAGWATTFSAADASLPRVDRVVLEVKDSNVDASGLYEARLKVVSGTATSGATLTNLTGAAAVPSNCLLLANVLVDAAATSIVTAKIDTATPALRRRARPGSGAIGSVQVATRVADLVAVDGALAHLRIGSTPYEFIALVYDETAAKWASAPRTILHAANASGLASTTSTSYTQATWTTFSALQALADAGLTPQFRLTATALRCSGGATASLALLLGQWDDGGNPSALGSEFAAVTSTSAGGVNKASAWTQPGPTVTKAHGHLQVQIKTSSGAQTAALDAVMVEMRLVSA